MEHRLFKPGTFEEGQHAAVGNCNGFSMQERWKKETPLFAKAILSNTDIKSPRILDYGCGPGRLSKEILTQHDKARVVGLDDSADMRKQAEAYVSDKRFGTLAPHCLGAEKPFDLCYCVYVLQHVPAIQIRDILYRIYNSLKDDGIFVYCSSDYRMAIRFDNPDFCDDRFLGVNLREEISRLFKAKGPLFTKQQLDQEPILAKMVEGRDGGLAHPALVFEKKEIKGRLYDAQLDEIDKQQPAPASVKESNAKKLLLINRLAPGDVLVMSSAIRALHETYPGEYLTDIRTPCNELYNNNPYITKLNYSEAEYTAINKTLSKGKEDGKVLEMGDITVIDMQYPEIHRSGKSGAHFGCGHRKFLQRVLGVKIKQDDIRPDIFLSQAERDWLSPVVDKRNYEGSFWAINAGSKGDFTLKQYPYYQEVVDALKDEVQFVQIGQKSHNHNPLRGTIDMVGETTIRELIRLIYHADGVLTCVSLPMHIAAALGKPCVVVAGAREGTRWELYPNHQFLYTNGCLPCAPYDGCWRARLEDCNNKVEGVPKCLEIIKPEEISRAIRKYYEGGMIEEKGLLLPATVGKI